MDYFFNKEGKAILKEMVNIIQENKAYLCEIDGLIGDGDHGINMNKGFSLFWQTHLSQKSLSFTSGLHDLGTTLLCEIGGSMGPIYGTLFMRMAEAGKGQEKITLSLFRQMLQSGMDGLFDILEARVGDKTLIDTCSAALDSLTHSLQIGDSLSDALPKMRSAAIAGRDRTKNMVAKYGRSARLGERSRGVLDAGATSCCFILCAIADSAVPLIHRS